MRILFVADGRSPIAMNWIQYFIRTGCEVHLASTFPCEPTLPFASFAFVPVAFSGAKAKQERPSKRGMVASLFWSPSTVHSRTLLRQLLGPLTLRRAARRLKDLIDEIKPDLVHAMRIPYEGMLASLAQDGASWRDPVDISNPSGGAHPPLLVSVWGNDFTLHAAANPWMARLTRQTLQRSTAIHTDCRRDLRLAREWGFAKEKPAIVLPGGGGVQLDIFYPPPQGNGQEPASLRSSTVINPRGFRAYVRNDTFFRAIPAILARLPQTRFLCPGMAGESQASGWIQSLGIKNRVDLLHTLPREQMADLFRRSAVTVSPTVHDGTPNTLLEGMACGCFPVAGDLESIREWISPGVNGFLVDPGDPQELAEAMLAALSQPDLRVKAADRNLKIVRERAEYQSVMDSAGRFYRDLVTGN